MTLITGKKNLSMFHMLQVRYALDIQARTGLRHSRGSVLKLAQQVYGVKAKTASGAVKEMDAIIEAARAEAS